MSAVQDASNLNFQSIEIAKIDVAGGRRPLDPAWVETLADDFKRRGMRTAIEVLQTDGRYRLVSGAHRLAAQKLNGATEITAVVSQPDDFAGTAEIRMAEIVENFMRRELSVLDRAFDVAAWREIFEAVQGTVGRGGDRRSKSKSQVATLIGDEAVAQASDRFAGNFTAAAQTALGLSRDAIFRSLKIARIGESTRQRIALLPIANNQSELTALAAEPVARQVAIADRLSAGAASVQDALAIIDDLPPVIPPARWEALGERFARLKADEQERFFQLYEDAIVRWVATRSKA